MEARLLNLAIVGPGLWGRKLVESVQGVSDRVRFTHAVVNRVEPVKEFCEKRAIAVTRDYASVLADPSVHGVVSKIGRAHV